MQPIQITIRDIPASQALEDHIIKKAQKLDHFYQRIQRCKVVIDMPQKHKHQGKLYRARIDLFVPGKELVVNRKLDQDVYIAIRDAFQAVTRKLESYARRRRGDIKRHTGVNYGYISRIFFDEGYGFIQATEGSEHYFSITNVYYPAFESLEVGDIVNFISVPANDGLQAHRVTRNNHNHE